RRSPLPSPLAAHLPCPSATGAGLPPGPGPGRCHRGGPRAPAGRAPPRPRRAGLRLRSSPVAGTHRPPTTEGVRMSELLGFDAALPWWAWMLMVVGLIALIGVIGALFLPDWPSDQFQEGFQAEPGSDEFVEWTSAFLNSTLFQGGQVTLLNNGDAFYPAMLEAIRNAKDSVNFEVYIFEPDAIGRQFLDAFKERARAGVDVRFLLDGFGCIKLTKRYRDDLRQAGVRVERFRPLGLRNLVRLYRREHRRATVIDGRIGFTGGAAVSEKWKGNVTNAHEWRDSMTRVTGPMVAGIQSAFATNWVYCCGEVIAGPRFFPALERGPGPCGLSVVSSPSDSLQPIRLLFWVSFINAQRRLWICNSYF